MIMIAEALVVGEGEVVEEQLLHAQIHVHL
jgi:hypothetical protein